MKTINTLVEKFDSNTQGNYWRDYRHYAGVVKNGKIQVDDA